MAAIDILLEHMVRSRASDLHLSAGRLPMIRVAGDMIPVAGMPVLEDRVLEGVVTEIMPDAMRGQFASEHDADFAYAVRGIGRFRCNIFKDQGGVCGTFRHIPETMPSAADLRLPDVLLGLADLEDGLVLVTGPTGSGKSTTLAALVDHVNRSHPVHIITIEDPVEFVHTSRR